MTEKINIQKIETGSSIYQISPVTKNWCESNDY
jgi:hypothetical protein